MLSKSTTTGKDHRGRLAMLLSLFAVALWLVQAGPAGDFVGLKSDSAIYLLMADHYSQHVPASALTDFVQQVSQFPPLYPLLLALAGADSSRLAIVQLLHSLSLLVMLGLAARLAWRLSGSVLVALATLWCVATLPLTLLLHSGVWSEFTYMAFATGALLLAPTRDAPLSRHWACALLCALATATRSAGVTLTAAFAVTLLARAPRRAWPALLLTALPLGVQSLLYRGSGSAYLSLFTERTRSASGLVATLNGNVAALWHGWQLQFTLTPGTAAAIPATLLLGLAALGLWQRWRVLAMDAIYVSCYALLLLVWPFPEVMDRLLYPLTPLLLIYAVLGTAFLGRRLATTAGWPSLLPAALCLATALPTTLAMTQQLLHAPPSFMPWRASREWLQAPDIASARADVNFKRTLITLMRQSAKLVPADQCIYAVQPGPAMYYTRRVSFPAPTGTSRPAEPRCRYQLLLGDASLEAARQELWQPNEIALMVSDGGQPAGQLVHYPAVR